MHFYKIVAALATVITIVIAAPTLISADEVWPPLAPMPLKCGDKLDGCHLDNCNGKFFDPWTLHGVCTSGLRKGCPCDKCGAGDFLYANCHANECNEHDNVCRGGMFQGCGCWTPRKRALDSDDTGSRGTQRHIRRDSGKATNGTDSYWIDGIEA